MTRWTLAIVLLFTIGILCLIAVLTNDHQPCTPETRMWMNCR